MTEAHRNPKSIPEQWLSDSWIDRLVDGELSAAEYKSVVEALDRHPEHWRRCAQAFLEAQAWRTELSDWMNPDLGPANSTTGERPVSNSQEAFASEDGFEPESGLSEDDVEETDWDRPRLTASVLSNPQSALGSRANSHWQGQNRSWVDFAAPLASAAVLLIVFAAGWHLGQPEKVQSIEVGQGSSALEPVAASINPMGHVKLAVDGRNQDMTIPYYFPADYPNVSTVSSTNAQPPNVEHWIGNRPVERQRAVMPSRLDERHDVLVPIEVISIPGQTEFQ